MLALYGHPFSSYTWKVLIALYADETPFEFRIVDEDHPEHVQVVQGAGPLGKFPVLADGDNLIFESTSIIEYLAKNHPGDNPLIPHDPDAAIDPLSNPTIREAVARATFEHLIGFQLTDAQLRYNATR